MASEPKAILNSLYRKIPSLTQSIIGHFYCGNTNTLFNAKLSEASLHSALKDITKT